MTQFTTLKAEFKGHEAKAFSIHKTYWLLKYLYDEIALHKALSLKIINV